jgi:enamine deaminase RidA (YjgF/YER057c/UK114 family)
MKTLDYDRRLIELGIELPTPPQSYFNYVPTLISGNHLYISGQLSSRSGEPHHRGRLGEDASLESTQVAARQCGLNILAHVRKACGGTLNHVAHCVRITGYVNASSDCYQHAEAMDGCSDLMYEIFGEVGRHTRSTVGVASLPFNALIEIDAIFEIREVPASTYINPTPINGDLA